MACVKLLGFALRVVGDGSDATVTVNVTTGPIGLKIPQHGDANYILPPGFVINTVIPSDVINVASDNGRTVSLTSLTLGVATFTYSPALPADEIDTIYGDLVFGS